MLGSRGLDFLSIFLCLITSLMFWKRLIYSFKTIFGNVMFICKKYLISENFVCQVNVSRWFESASSISWVKLSQLAFLKFVKVLMFGSNRKLFLVLIVMIIGRWSERRGVVLSFQFALSDKFDDMVVMSGDVGCCAWFADDLVCSFWFSIVCSEFCIRSATKLPLWSEKGEYHSEECAFMSPAMSEFLVAVSCVRSEVMWLLSVSWETVLFLGGMYRFVSVSFSFLDREILIDWLSMWLLSVSFGEVIGVKEISFKIDKSY